MTSTLITFYVLLWLMLISEAYERMLPGFFLLGLALGVARLSVGLGRLLSRWMEATLGLDGNLVVIAALAFLAVATSLVFLGYLHSTSAKKRAGAVRGEEDVEDAGMLDEGGAAVSDGREAGRRGVVHANAGHAGAGHAHAGSKDVQGEATAPDREPGVGPADAAFELLVATYGLSEREAEIVREYSSGRSARYIADWFMLSEYTVKTHLRRSYVKMGIHSRQELLDTLEEMESRLLRD